MGDRGNIVMVEKTGNKIYFYTHWDGSDLPRILRQALIRGKGRWDDEPYLARIIFSEMIKDNILEETGYGISTYQPDYNHSDLEVHCSSQTVGWKNQNWSFDDYVQLTTPIPNY